MRRKEKAVNKSLFIWSFSSLACDQNHSSEKKKKSILQDQVHYIGQIVKYNVGLITVFIYRIELYLKV